MTIPVETVYSAGKMAAGRRQIYVGSAGTLEGQLSGRVLPGGTDHLLIDADGLGLVDARLTWELDGGVIVYVQYIGRLMMNDKVAEAFKSGGETQFGDTNHLVQIRFETGNEQYSWLNATTAIGEGRIAKGGCIQYNIYRCDTSQAQ